MQPPSSRPERLVALTRGLERAWRPQRVAAEGIGVIAFAAAVAAGFLDDIPYGGPGRLVAGALLVLAVSLAAKSVLLPGDVRAALEAFSWIGRWEWLRARAEVTDPFPATPRAIRAYVDGTEPVPHPAWVELLVFAGETDRAAELAERLPARTPWERFEREAVRAFLRWAQTGRNEDGAARRALADIDDPDERLQAEGQLALGEARAGLSAGDDDWTSPLLALRQRLGERADGVLRHEWWRAQALAGVPLAVAVSVIGHVLANFA